MRIISITPSNGSTNVALTTPIRIKFSQQIDITSISNDSIIVGREGGRILTTHYNNPNVIYSEDAFLFPYGEDVIQGNITIDENDNTVLVFTPITPYAPNTQYKVFISRSIKSTSSAILDKIYTATFTTVEEDLSKEYPIPQNIEYITIIDKYLNVLNESPLDINKFTIIETTPAKDSFLNTNRDILIKFSHSVDSNSTQDKIIIYIYDLLSDYPPRKITNFTTLVNADTITITLPDTISIVNVIFVIKILPGILSTSGIMLEQEYVLSYIGDLVPYESSTKLIRLYAGVLLSNVRDVNIALHIYTASLEAYRLVAKANMSYIQKKTFIQSYTLYLTLYRLLTNNIDYDLPSSIRKELGDFAISIENGHRVSLYNALLSDIKKQLDRLKSMLNFLPEGGYFLKNSAHRMDSGIGRMWTVGIGVNSKIDQGERNLLIWDDIMGII